MKILTTVSILCLMIFLAGTAQAYAIYNHTDYDICINKWYSIECHVKVHKHGTYNGGHNEGLSSVWANWHAHGECILSDKFSIPDGGYARIYNDNIKIYKHSGDHVKTVGAGPADCSKKPK